MKTIKSLILAILITFSIQVSANTDHPVDEFKSVSQQIVKLLKNSDTPIYDNIVVMIKFKVNNNNKIIEVSTNSNNYKISKFIKARLNFEQLSIGKKSKYRFYSIPVKFLSTED